MHSNEQDNSLLQIPEYGMSNQSEKIYTCPIRGFEQEQDLLEVSNSQFFSGAGSASQYNNYYTESKTNSCSTFKQKANIFSPKSNGYKSNYSTPMSFPIKLYDLLNRVEEEDLSGIISWQPHGRSFKIHNSKKFAENVMKRFFRQTKLTSFQRQLNLYNFSRISSGRDRGG